jgi:iron(III) transport system substrate-binding protein
MDLLFATKTHRRLRGAWASVAVAALLAACSATPAATTAPSPTASPAPTAASIESLVALAKNEKGVVMYGNAPDTYFKPVVEAFKAAYPGIAFAYTSVDDNTVFSKYQSEKAQGARTADLLLASAPALWIQAQDNGVVAKVTPQGLSNFPSYAMQAPGLFVMSPEPIISTYNTKIVAAGSAPTSYAALAAAVKADPTKYKLASYPIDNQLGYSAIYGLIKVLGWDAYWALQDQLAPNTKTFSEGLTALQQVAGGAAVYGYNGSGLGQVVVPAATKGLVDYLFMQDATPLIPRAIAVTAGAASPASATLFLDYLFSEPGQQVLCASGFEAYKKDFAPQNNCVAYLGALEKKVPTKNIYLVPIAKDVLDQQSKIVERWNQSYKR